MRGAAAPVVGVRPGSRQRPAPVRSAARGVASQGLTLIELLLVMLLIGILLGLGTLGVQRMDPGARALQDAVATFLESSRDRARATGQGVRVEIDPGDPELDEPARLVRYVFRRVREATFEPEMARGEGLELLAPSDIEEAGRFGAALDLRQGGSALVRGRGGRLAAQHGLAIELELLPTEGGAGSLVEWDDLLQLDLDRSGRLEFALEVQVDEERVPIRLRSEPAAVLPGGWQHLRASAADGRLTIRVDGRLVANEAFEGSIPESSGALRLGDSDGSLRGLLDEFVVWARVPEKGPDFRPEVGALFEPPVLLFDRHGFLDALRHSEPVAVRLVELGSVVGQFQVGRFTEEVLP